jgi:hypothetical protein
MIYRLIGEIKKELFEKLIIIKININQEINLK